MTKLERIGVSLDKGLLSKFDKLISEQGYQSRSEALRDLVRPAVERRAASKIRRPKPWRRFFIVYNHHSTKLTKSLIDLQHTHMTSATLQVISSLHVHLNEHDCLEVIVLRGRVSEINHVAERILSMKGVKLGRVNVVAM